MTIRVVVADDDLLVRAGVVTVLGLIDEVAVVAEAADLDELLAAVADHQPDVVVTDVRMPPTLTDEGVRATEHIREQWPAIGVVVLSQQAELANVVAVFDAGNTGVAYLLKENVGDIEVLRHAVTAVHGGGTAIDPEVVSVLVSNRTAKPSAVDRLTPRETEVLSLIAEGLNNATIAERLVLSDRAVGKHISAIFSKLDLGGEDTTHHRVRAVLLWLSARG